MVKINTTTSWQALIPLEIEWTRRDTDEINGNV